MTDTDPTPGDKGPDNLDSELQLLVDAEKMEDIEFDEFMLESRIHEDKMVDRLLSADFPFLAEILAIRTQLGVESGLTELYEYLVHRTNEFQDEVESTLEPSSALRYEWRLTHLQSRLVITIQQLAAAKGAQESVLVQAQEFDNGGDVEQASRLRELAYETRKEAEAQVLTDEFLGGEAAARILSAVAPEFEGESLVPITLKSQEYLIIHRLKEEESDNNAIEMNACRITAQELLERKLSAGQKQHPDFNDFAISLSSAAARTVLKPKHTIGYGELQLDGYNAVIGYHLRRAMDIAPQMGVEPRELLSMYEGILTQLS